MQFNNSNFKLLTNAFHFIEKQIDLTKVNLKKLKVKDLKKILSDWDEQCKGCTEKSDFISKIKDLMPVHAPEAAKVLKKRDEL